MPKHSPEVILAALRAEGIPCEAHQLGLAAHCRDPTAYAKALKACMPAPPVLRAVEPPPCKQDAMLCACPQHTAERVRAIRRGPSRIRQPWEPQSRAA